MLRRHISALCVLLVVTGSRPGDGVAGSLGHTHSALSFPLRRNTDRSPARAYGGALYGCCDRNDRSNSDPLWQSLFQIGELHHDIAILRLHAPVRYSPRIQPICLPDRDTGDLRNQSLSEAGWGSIGGASDSLRSADLRIVDMDTCQKRYANISQLLADGLRDFKLCAIPARVGLAKSCNGVSGDPMVAVKHDHHRRVLVGIVSGGKRCGGKEYPGIYTRVSSYLDWIRKVTKATSKKS